MRKLRAAARAFHVALKRIVPHGKKATKRAERRKTAQIIFFRTASRKVIRAKSQIRPRLGPISIVRVGVSARDAVAKCRSLRSHESGSRGVEESRSREAVC